MRFVTRLYFGRNMPDGGAITDAQINGFLREVVSVAFPSGFTLIHAEGGWTGSTGFIREPSAVLEVYHNGFPSDRGAINLVAREYKYRFVQDAVMVVTDTLAEEVQFI